MSRRGDERAIGKSPTADGWVPKVGAEIAVTFSGYLCGIVTVADVTGHTLTDSDGNRWNIGTRTLYGTQYDPAYDRDYFEPATDAHIGKMCDIPRREWAKACSKLRRVRWDEVTNEIVPLIADCLVNSASQSETEVREGLDTLMLLWQNGKVG